MPEKNTSLRGPLQISFLGPSWYKKDCLGRHRWLPCRTTRWRKQATQNVYWQCPTLWFRYTYHTFDILTLCAINGVTLNLPKFQFCQDTIEFAIFKLTPAGIFPSDSILAGIRDFPQPKDLTSTHAWIGLVDQVAWAYSNTTVMQPFRDLVKPNPKFF